MTIKITFNQNIRNRLNLINGTYERIDKDNNSIIIKISELKTKKTFNFSDNIDESYYFGFELEIISHFDLLFLVIIIICSIFFILFIVFLSLYCKAKKNMKESNNNRSFGINNNSLLN